MSKDLARAAEKKSQAAGGGSGKKDKKKSLPAQPFGVAMKAFQRHDGEGLGFVKVRQHVRPFPRIGRKYKIIGKLPDTPTNYQSFALLPSNAGNRARSTSDGSPFPGDIPFSPSTVWLQLSNYSIFGNTLNSNLEFKATETPQIFSLRSRFSSLLRSITTLWHFL